MKQLYIQEDEPNLRHLLLLRWEQFHIFLDWFSNSKLLQNIRKWEPLWYKWAVKLNFCSLQWNIDTSFKYTLNIRHENTGFYTQKKKWQNQWTNQICPKKPTTCSAKPNHRNLSKAATGICWRPPPKATVFPVKFLAPLSLSVCLPLCFIWVVFLTKFWDGLSFSPNYSNCGSSFTKFFLFIFVYGSISFNTFSYQALRDRWTCAR